MQVCRSMCGSAGAAHPKHEQLEEVGRHGARGIVLRIAARPGLELVTPGAPGQGMHHYTTSSHLVSLVSISSRMDSQASLICRIVSVV